MSDQTTFENKRASLLELQLNIEEMRDLYYVAYWGIVLIYGQEPPEYVKNMLAKINKCIKAGE